MAALRVPNLLDRVIGTLRTRPNRGKSIGARFHAEQNRINNRVEFFTICASHAVGWFFAFSATHRQQIEHDISDKSVRHRVSLPLEDDTTICRERQPGLTTADITNGKLVFAKQSTKLGQHRLRPRCSKTGLDPHLCASARSLTRLRASPPFHREPLADQETPGSSRSSGAIVRDLIVAAEAERFLVEIRCVESLKGTHVRWRPTQVACRANGGKERGFAGAVLADKQRKRTDRDRRLPPGEAAVVLKDQRVHRPVTSAHSGRAVPPHRRS